MLIAAYKQKSNIYAKYVYDGGHACVGCGKGRSINRSLDDDRAVERVNFRAHGMVTIYLVFHDILTHWNQLGLARVI